LDYLSCDTCGTYEPPIFGVASYTWATLFPSTKARLANQGWSQTCEMGSSLIATGTFQLRELDNHLTTAPLRPATTKTRRDDKAREAMTRGCVGAREPHPKKRYIQNLNVLNFHLLNQNGRDEGVSPPCVCFNATPPRQPTNFLFRGFRPDLASATAHRLAATSATTTTRVSFVSAQHTGLKRTRNGCTPPISQQGMFWIQNNILIYANHFLIAGIDGSWP